ncbi:hypothetical protein B0J14DRAFT_205958 [Halenospora varia]|nr:hypothetical protein B0J14DRAFT_205958 [Halenospora varia]
MCRLSFFILPLPSGPISPRALSNTLAYTFRTFCLLLPSQSALSLFWTSKASQKSVQCQKNYLSASSWQTQPPCNAPSPSLALPERFPFFEDFFGNICRSHRSLVKYLFRAEPTLQQEEQQIIDFLRTFNGPPKPPMACTVARFPIISCGLDTRPCMLRQCRSTTPRKGFRR